MPDGEYHYYEEVAASATAVAHNAFETPELESTNSHSLK